jgi:putative hemolysin
MDQRGYCRFSLITIEALEKNTPELQTGCKYVLVRSTSAPASEDLKFKCILFFRLRSMYGLPNKSEHIFITEKNIARKESRNKIIKDLERADMLGETLDKHEIYLAKYSKGSALIKEIGRLRELAFREVGEGTGCSRDLDNYDKHYRHLTLWHKQNQEIVGAYRIGEAGKIITENGIQSLYTANLYHYSDAILPRLQQCFELGRSFVHPDYWGKACLDYLWQGIGAFLRHNKNIHYLIGPVSMSADFPESLRNELVFYFEHYYKSDEQLATAHKPYHLPIQEKHRLQKAYSRLNKEQGMKQLQNNFKVQGYKIPILFKQYSSLFEDGGIKLLAFSIDPNFGNCIDGLLMADLRKLKEKKRARYID